MNTKPTNKDKKLHLSDCVEHFSNSLLEIKIL